MLACFDVIHHAAQKPNESQILINAVKPLGSQYVLVSSATRGM